MLFPVLALWLFHVWMCSSTPEQIKTILFSQAFCFTLKLGGGKEKNFLKNMWFYVPASNGLLCEAGRSINNATDVTFGKKVGFLLVVPVLSTFCIYITILAQIRTVVQWTFYSCHHMGQSYFHSWIALRGCGTKMCAPDTNEYSVLRSAAWSSE